MTQAAIKSALDAVRPGTDERVPLNNAVKAAFFALDRSGGSRADRILTIFTAGPDTCTKTGLGGMLQDLGLANPALRIRQQIYDPRFLALTVAVAFTEDQRRLWQTELARQFRIEDARTVVLIAHTRESLRLIQPTTSTMSAPLMRNRRMAFLHRAELATKLGALPSKADQTSLIRYCRAGR
jgi:hypothetical protein